jgi:hypothetical protein
MSQMPTLRCPTCNTEIRGRYCGKCGLAITPTARLSLPPVPLTDAEIDRAARLQPFNRWFLDWPDPTHAIGARLPVFSLNQNYNVDRQKGKAISRHIYRTVFHKLQNDALSGTQINVIDYLDHKYRLRCNEKPRRFITITHETNRKTRSTILARFLPDGGNIFIGVDAYVLGPFDWFKCLKELFFLPVLLCVCMCITLYLLYKNDSLLRANDMPMFLLLPILYLAFLLVFLYKRRSTVSRIIRSYRREHRVLLALRQTYHRSSSNHAFNEDDVHMFFKSTLTLIVDSAIDVFEKNGISAGQFKRYVMNINNNLSIFGDGTINQIGNQMGGAGNTMSGNTMSGN